MKSLKTASILILAVFLLSMVSGVSAADKCSVIPVNNLTVNVNEMFNITLEYCPSSAYSWEYEFDQNYLELVNKTYVPNLPIICGSGGCSIFTFKALKAGKTDITMKYLRPWKNWFPEEEIIYHINIVN